MKLQGKVVKWNDKKGFGFVEPNGGGERAFVHINAFSSKNRRPVNGDVIIYQSVYDNNDRYTAQDIKFFSSVDSTASKNTKRTRSSVSNRSKIHNTSGYNHSSQNQKKNQGNGQKGSHVSLVFFIVFCIFLGTSTLIGRLPSFVVIFYIAVSCITFITYAIDKLAAKNNRFRTAENTLHSLSLFGGWPGAYLAQNILRHKSIKKPFKRVFWFTALLNVAGLIWLHTEQGSQFLARFIH